MKRFDYLAPRSLAEALERLSDRPGAIPLAGGTDLLVRLKDVSRSVETLVSLKRVPELRQYAYYELPITPERVWRALKDKAVPGA